MSFERELAGVAQRPYRVPPGATELILVRHGASAHAVEGEPFEMVEGRGDPPLSDAGHREAEHVAARLAAEPFARLFITPLRRTAQTAAPLAAATGHEPEVVPDLIEVGLGDWADGTFRIRVAEGHPIARRIYEEERWDVIPNAEPAEEFTRRVTAGLRSVVAATGADAAAVVVTHGGVIGDACRQATRSRPFAFVHADNGSITRLVHLPDGAWLLRSFNDGAHLGT